MFSDFPITAKIREGRNSHLDYVSERRYLFIWLVWILLQPSVSWCGTSSVPRLIFGDIPFPKGSVLCAAGMSYQGGTVWSLSHSWHFSSRPDGIGTVTVDEKERFEEIKERLRLLLENQITHFR